MRRLLCLLAVLGAAYGACAATSSAATLLVGTYSHGWFHTASRQSADNRHWFTMDRDVVDSTLAGYVDNCVAYWYNTNEYGLYDTGRTLITYTSNWDAASIKMWDGNFGDTGWAGLTFWNDYYKYQNNQPYSFIALNTRYLNDPGQYYLSARNSAWSNHAWFKYGTPCHELGHALGLAHDRSGVMQLGVCNDPSQSAPCTYDWQPVPEQDESYTIGYYYDVVGFGG